MGAEPQRRAAPPARPSLRRRRTAGGSGGGGGRHRRLVCPGLVCCDAGATAQFSGAGACLPGDRGWPAERARLKLGRVQRSPAAFRSKIGPSSGWGLGHRGGQARKSEHRGRSALRRWRGARSSHQAHRGPVGPLPSRFRQVVAMEARPIRSKRPTADWEADEGSGATSASYSGGEDYCSDFEDSSECTCFGRAGWGWGDPWREASLDGRARRLPRPAPNALPRLGTAESGQARDQALAAAEERAAPRKSREGIGERGARLPSVPGGPSSPGIVCADP